MLESSFLERIIDKTQIFHSFIPKWSSGSIGSEPGIDWLDLASASQQSHWLITGVVCDVGSAGGVVVHGVKYHAKSKHNIHLLKGTILRHL